MIRDGDFFSFCLCLAVVAADQSTLRGRVSPARRRSPLVQSSMAVCRAAVYEKMLRQSTYHETRQMPGQRRSYEATYSRAPIPQIHLHEMRINSALRAPLYAWPCQSVGYALAPWPILGQRGCIQHTTSEHGTSSAGKLACYGTSNGYTTCLFSPDPAIFGLGHSEREPWPFGP